MTGWPNGLPCDKRVVMCGIVGKVYADRERPVEAMLIDTMTDALLHRGPDARGVWSGHGAALGHRRLSIIDLSPGANQPMSSPTGTVIVFNGEIYNYQLLRRMLESEGWQFRTRSDTEVLLALYERHGERCVDELIGMFAFAIWDPGRRRLFAARDRLGKKPLYYHATAEGFAFASELSSLLADPEVPVAIDPDAIHHYLTLHYVPSPSTAFAGIAKLPPAHTLTWQDGKLAVSRYWQPQFEPKTTHSEDELCEELWELFRDATRIRMLSDVPLGAFLSGGTDSSTIVSVMSELSPTRLKTFSIGFRESAFNELAYAAQVAKRYGTEHHEELVTPDATVALPELVAHHGEPFSDPSSIPTYYLAKLTRQHVTVALSGDGGDEVFGGYNRYVWSWMAGLFDRWPRAVVDPVARLTEWIGHLAVAPVPVRLAGQHISTVVASEAERYLSFAGHFTPRERGDLYTHDFRRSLTADTHAWYRATVDGSTAKAPLDRYIQNDLRGYLSDGIMTKVDIASMCHSLEVRAPFLDHRIVELGARLPVHLKQSRWRKRVLFKRAVKDRLPRSILDRPKRGFGIPVAAWLRGPLQPMLRDLVTGSRARSRGIFDGDAVERFVADHVARRADHGHKLWNLMVLELWARRFIDAGRPRMAQSASRPAVVG
jgi:asparagine synthase (glutamine-hydrolysing)